MSTLRRIMVVTALAVAATTVADLATSSAAPATTTETRPDQPNLVFIITDDQTLESVDVMPFLSSQPGGHWFDFPNAVVSTPLCCPARSTILSGQYDFHTGVQDNDDGELFDDSSTVATWLDEAGYRTGLVGKYLNTYPFSDTETFTPPGWDYWAASSGRGGYYDHDVNDNGTVVHYGSTESDYSTDVYRDYALSFLAEPSPDPFFLYFAPKAPHEPSTPAPRHADALSDIPIPHAPNFNEDAVSDKPAWVQALPELSPNAITRMDEQKRDQYRSLLAVDEAIEAMFGAIEATGEIDDTIFVFMTDNGSSMGSHRWVHKRCAYEECVRTPLLVRYPWGAGGVVSDLVSNIDLASTWAELAGATAGVLQDGQSFVPLLDGTAAGWRDEVLLHQVNDGSGPVTFWGVRTADRKYVENITGEVELYDLAVDPYELVNVADEPAYASDRAQLAHDLERLKHTIDVDLAPDSLPADGTSTAIATVTVTDETGAPVTGEPLVVTASGDASVSAVTDNGDGTYTATITASTTAGDEIITASNGPNRRDVTLHELATVSVVSVDPAARGQWATAFPIEVNGSGFVPGASVSFGADVNVQSVAVDDATSLIAVVAPAKTASIGPRDVTVTKPNGTTGVCVACFTVTPRPRPLSANPEHLEQGATTAVVMVTGANFVVGASVSFGGDVTVGTVQFVNRRTLRATVDVDAGATVGPRTVVVTNPDGGRGTCVCFAVEGAAGP